MYKARRALRTPLLTCLTLGTLLLLGTAPALADVDPCAESASVVEAVVEDGADDSQKKKKKKKKKCAAAAAEPSATGTDPRPVDRPAIADTIQEMQASGAPILSPEPVPMWGGR